MIGIRKNLPATANPAEQVQPQHIFDLLHCKPRLRHPFAPFRQKRAKDGGLQRLTSIRPMPGGQSRGAPCRAPIRHAGQRSAGSAKVSAMPPEHCPASFRNAVRLQSGIVSGMAWITQPCDTCRHAARCRVEDLACEARCCSNALAVPPTNGHMRHDNRTRKSTHERTRR